MGPVLLVVESRWRAGGFDRYISLSKVASSLASWASAFDPFVAFAWLLLQKHMPGSLVTMDGWI